MKESVNHKRNGYWKLRNDQPLRCYTVVAGEPVPSLRTILTNQGKLGVILSGIFRVIMSIPWFINLSLIA